MPKERMLNITVFDTEKGVTDINVTYKDGVSGFCKEDIIRLKY